MLKIKILKNSVLIILTIAMVILSAPTTFALNIADNISAEDAYKMQSDI